MKAEDVHFHALKLFPFPLTAEESSRSVLDKTRLALAHTGDIWGNKVFCAYAFPRLTGAGRREGSLALNASGEGLLFADHRRRGGTTGNGGRGEIKELMGGHTKLFSVGGTVWRETRLELHGGRMRDGGGIRGCREGVIGVRIG
jgi:hypothetical protein